ncbi:MAG: UDP-N-acetylglucosamine 2-epimerase [Omnitrophica WOR_2 bacterium RIFCSPHIGHO2_01_FULL_48_9]|nr:MAG: UDP-N-acetylglucosamine 2-epimerase [Omnitrophica WOR_2 bacterium RIFCSPHIGHO2_02_FULL_48_11]OGX34080.1 MAG: UDP-N-acetylglucosamine 2-epimerase [Omnitrophica WOR_2 bacterium RIFCSPHIGHO2_01_FULL_48_9]
MLKVLLVFGTRPEVIKMAPLIKEFKKYADRIECKVCISGQHRQMIDPLLKLFDIKVDYDLNIMQANQDLEHINTSVLREIGKILEAEKFDYVFVQGDTTTAMAAALAAFYKKVKVAHVEAGLRTFDKFHPYPEEVNRKIIDSVADLYFAHTQLAQENLLKEGVRKKDIEVTGNTVIDALLEVTDKPFDFQAIPKLAAFSRDKRKLILVTAHRRENFGQPIRNICEAIKHLAAEFSKEIIFIYPVHLNPNIRRPVYEILENIPNVLLTEPLEYLPFSHLLKRCYLVLSDSGGVQEEAPSLGKPVLVMRQTTERPEGIKAGCVEVVGTDTKKVIGSIRKLLKDKKKYQKMSRVKNPYGDGKASQRIVKRVLKEKL